jgi:uncharacterized protein YbcI
MTAPDEPAGGPREEAVPHDAAALISSEIVRIHENSYGTGGTVNTHFVGDDYVITIMENDLTPAERTLIDGGRGDAVQSTRMAFQDAIESTFKAVAERATGRRVEAFVSHLHVDPMFTVELFKLAPRKAPPDELGG